MQYANRPCNLPKTFFIYLSDFPKIQAKPFWLDCCFCKSVANMEGKIFQKRSLIFKTGVILIAFWSIFIGFFNIAVLYWFGIPILGLFLGIVLVWVAKVNVKSKFFLTIIPIPIILTAFFIFYLLLPRAEPETFLIPQNFRGQFEIIFNEPCGQTIPYEKGRRIYQFPDNGILITNAKQTFGVIDRKFYLINEKVNQTQLSEFHRTNFEKEQNDWHWTFSRTKLSKNLVGVINHPSNINYLIFTVSDYESLETESKEIRDEKQKSFQNMVNALLKECGKTR